MRLSHHSVALFFRGFSGVNARLLTPKSRDQVALHFNLSSAAFQFGRNTKTYFTITVPINESQAAEISFSAATSIQYWVALLAEWLVAHGCSYRSWLSIAQSAMPQWGTPRARPHQSLHNAWAEILRTALCTTQD